MTTTPAGYEVPDDLDDDPRLWTGEPLIDEEGTVIVRSAVGLESTWEDDARSYHVVEHLQEVVSAFPAHQFVGRLDCEGEEAGDLWRLCVIDGKATRVEPRIVWPEDESET